jgi:hypothetical protein
MLNEKRTILSVVIFSILFALFVAASPKQDSTAQDEKILEWKKRLKEYPPSKISTELTFQYSFPSDELQKKDIYLWGPRRIACDSGGNIFVLDGKWKSIIKFDSKGNFLKRTGREGQGPGEFQNPYCLCVSKNSVFVSDTMKYDIQIFDLDLNFVKSLKVARAYTELVVRDDGLMVGTPFRMAKEMSLVDVLSKDGEVLYSFGKLMFGDDRNWQIPNFVKIDVNRKGEVFLAFWQFPTVCKYSAEGELRAVYRIVHKEMSKAEQLNIRAMKDLENRTSWQAIYAIRAKENGFFLLHNYPYTEVLEFDGDGKMINDYRVARSYDYSVWDFLVKETDGIEVFFMEIAPESKIEVFRPSQSKR